MANFCDEVLVRVRAGSGGRGIVSFRHEKYAPKGGPDGGDGGNGGDVTLIVNENINTLSYFRHQAVFRAGDGKVGGGKQSTGKSGDSLVMEVPVGTIVSNPETAEIIADLVEPGQTAVIARGGRGGYGNAHFKASTRQSPEFAERGEPGQDLTVKLVLKLVADVAIIGLPSCGKSTLIAHISNARPKIADYPFTTLIPNLGVVEVGEYDFVVADIPGLIEGAHKGKGLGHEFLRHTERTRVLVHLLDVTSTDAVADYKVIRNELKLYSKELAKKPELIVLNKVDVLGEDLVPDMVRDMKKKLKKEVLPISAVTGFGIKELLYAITQILAQEKKSTDAISEEKPKYKVFRPHLDKNEKSYHIEKKLGVYLVHGKRIEQIITMTDFSNEQAVTRVYDVFRKLGITKALKRLGCKEGDIVRIGEIELEFNDAA